LVLSANKLVLNAKIIYVPQSLENYFLAHSLWQEKLNFLAHIVCAKKLEFYMPRKLEYLGA
jgi:hypothetical protein